jgi:hypothetical protein
MRRATRNCDPERDRHRNPAATSHPSDERPSRCASGSSDRRGRPRLAAAAAMMSSSSPPPPASLPAGVQTLLSHLDLGIGLSVPVSDASLGIPCAARCLIWLLELPWVSCHVVSLEAAVQFSACCARISPHHWTIRSTLSLIPFARGVRLSLMASTSMLLILIPSMLAVSPWAHNESVLC